MLSLLRNSAFARPRSQFLGFSRVPAAWRSRTRGLRQSRSFAGHASRLAFSSGPPLRLCIRTASELVLSTLDGLCHLAFARLA
eukprot:8424699-Alexandrium_andersonii.AAC.1